LFFDEETSGGTETSSYSKPNSSTTMGTNASGEFVCRQTFQTFNYQTGKSQIVFLTFTNLTPETNIVKRVGYFSSGTTTPFDSTKDGMWLESSSDDVKIIVSRRGTEVFNVSQSNWDDPMDGTGESGVTIDWSKSQILMIDFEWLGVGRVRFGFYGNGIINYCHEIKNINSLTAPYMVNPNLPIRFEISSTSGSGSLVQICSSIISEGGYNPIGKPFSASNGITTIQISNTETPLLSIKGISTYYHQNIIPTGISILDTNNNTFMLYRIRIFKSPASDPGTFSWTNVNNNSVVRYAQGGTGVNFNGSIIVDEGYVYGGKGNILFNSLTDVFNSIFQITSDIDNNSDIIIITGQSFASSTPNVVASITWQEVY
jgi:hypothetical protein